MDPAADPILVWVYRNLKIQICGVEIIEELRRHGYAVSPGLIYPTLHSLKKDGYLKSERKGGSGSNDKILPGDYKGGEDA